MTFWTSSLLPLFLSCIVPDARAKLYTLNFNQKKGSPTHNQPWTWSSGLGNLTRYKETSQKVVQEYERAVMFRFNIKPYIIINTVFFDTNIIYIIIINIWCEFSGSASSWRVVPADLGFTCLHKDDNDYDDDDDNDDDDDDNYDNDDEFE